MKFSITGSHIKEIVRKAVTANLWSIYNLIAYINQLV